MDETWYTDVTSQEDYKNVKEGGDHSARFHVTMLTNTAIYRPFGKNRAQPKTRQKGEIFSIMHVVSYRM